MEKSVLKKTTKRDDLWEDLVVSVLSVNNWSIEKTYGIVDGLSAQRLCDPHQLAAFSQEEIAVRLKAAGCNRGAFMTNLFALRLRSLGMFVRERGVANCAKALSEGSRKEIEALLGSVNGIGPTVISNFCTLRGDFETE